VAVGRRPEHGSAGHLTRAQRAITPLARTFEPDTPNGHRRHHAEAIPDARMCRQLDARHRVSDRLAGGRRRGIPYEMPAPMLVEITCKKPGPPPAIRGSQSHERSSATDDAPGAHSGRAEKALGRDRPPRRSCIRGDAAAALSLPRSMSVPSLTTPCRRTTGASGFALATSCVSDNSAHRIRSRAAARISAAETPDGPTLPSASSAASLHHEMPANCRFL
jgi:hypothetical protein